MKSCDRCGHMEASHKGFFLAPHIIEHPNRCWSYADPVPNPEGNSWYFKQCECIEFEYDDFAHWVQDMKREAKRGKRRRRGPAIPPANADTRRFLAANRWEKRK